MREQPRGRAPAEPGHRAGTPAIASRPSRRGRTFPALAVAVCLAVTSAGGPVARAFANAPRPPRVLFIAIDAVPLAVMEQAATDPDNGFLRSMQGPVPMISTFPSTTSLALAAMLQPVGVEGSPGYEAKHYEWASNRVSGGGLFDYEPFPWRAFFDWKVETLFRKAVSAIRPIAAARDDIRESLDAYLASDRPIYFIYYDTTDSAGHLKGPNSVLPILAELDHRLADLHRDHPDDPFWTVIFSDHGMDGGRALHNTRAAVSKALRRGGFRLQPRIEGTGDVVIVPFGLVSSFVVYTAAGREEDAARAITRAKGVDLCVSRTTDGFRVDAERGRALIHRMPTDPPRWSYDWSGEDPLWLPADLHRSFSDGGWVSDGELFAATTDELYPDPFHRIASSFEQVENPASVVCSSARGYMYGAKITALGSRVSVGHLKWTHGALEHDASLGFLMSDVPTWRPLGPVRFDHALAPFTALWDGQGQSVVNRHSATVAAQQPSSTPPADSERPALTDAPVASSDQAEQRRSRRAEFETTQLTIDAERRIELRFDQPTTEDAAYRAVQSPVDGKVVAFVANRPPKLKTPVDLSFGDVVVKTHNQGPEYPGVYSLWLVNTGGRWRLRFNNLADVWGTQYDPAEDAAEIPLEVTTLTTPVETFTVLLQPAPGGVSGGILRLRWGSFEGSAAFTTSPGQ